MCPSRAQAPSDFLDTHDWLHGRRCALAQERQRRARSHLCAVPRRLGALTQGVWSFVHKPHKTGFDEGSTSMFLFDVLSNLIRTYDSADSMLAFLCFDLNNCELIFSFMSGTGYITMSGAGFIFFCRLSFGNVNAKINFPNSIVLSCSYCCAARVYTSATYQARQENKKWYLLELHPGGYPPLTGIR